jgi:murein L,D-transpeptidase YafK
MRHLARIFSALFLLSILGAGAALILLRPQETPMPPEILTAVDRIIIEKAERRITLIQKGNIARTYRIALGSSPVGDKIRQGDGRTPEGVFRINRKNAGSAFHLSLGLDYPQAADVARAKAGGYNPGGDIMIHGQPNALPSDAVIRRDWTAGCIAVSNAEIEEIFAATSVGTVVEVRP